MNQFRTATTGVPVKFAWALGGLTAFAALFHGAHDLWAASVVYLIGTGLAVVFLFKTSWSTDGPGVRLGLVVPVGAVLVAFSISFAQSVNPGESQLELMDWGVAVLLFLIGLSIFRSPLARSAFSACLVPVVWIEAILCAAQTVRAPGVIAGAEVFGTLINANILAAFLLPFIPVFLWYAKNPGDGGRSRWFWYSGAVAAGVSLLLTHSTWAFLIVIVVGAMTLARRTASTGRRWVWIAAVAVLVVGLLLWDKFTTVYPWAGPLPARRSTSRLAWWITGFAMFKEHWLAGVGLGNYASAYLAFEVGREQHTLSAHSFPVMLLAETGLLGVAAAGFFGWSWWRRVRAIIAGDVRAFAVGLALAGLYSLLSIGSEYLVIVMVAWIFMSMLAASTTTAGWKPRRSILIIAAALALASAVYTVSPFLASQNVVEARADLRQGKLDEAAEGFKDAAELDPRSSDAFRGWAEALYSRYLLRGDKEDLHEAIQRQKEAIRLNRLNGTLWWELGNYLKVGGRLEEAAVMMEQASMLHATNRRFLVDAEELRKQAARGK